MAHSKDSLQGLQLPELPAQQPEQESVYYLEAANGMTVRVPQSRLEAWQAEQDRQRKGTGSELTDSERRIKEAILARIYG